MTDSKQIPYMGTTTAAYGKPSGSRSISRRTRRPMKREATQQLPRRRKNSGQFPAKVKDYANSGYDQGHQVLADTARWSQKAVIRRSRMSNTFPQVGDWSNLYYRAYLKAFCKNLTPQYLSVRVMTGPLYLPKKWGEWEMASQLRGANVIGEKPRPIKLVELIGVLKYSSPGPINNELKAISLYGDKSIPASFRAKVSDYNNTEYNRVSGSTGTTRLTLRTFTRISRLDTPLSISSRARYTYYRDIKMGSGVLAIREEENDNERIGSKVIISAFILPNGVIKDDKNLTDFKIDLNIVERASGLKFAQDLKLS
ncbi:hypothetical protein N7507_001977 [Penicillium longicatenatum]|nr:hypothetical protein N7507_001977 [Penicillium longicatenatum]